MSKFKSILCPKTEEHKFDKNLLFVGDGGLYAFCKEHSWIKIIFKKGNKQINFENVAVVLEPMGENFVFDHEPMPVVALGDFNLRKNIKDRRDAKSKQNSL